MQTKIADAIANIDASTVSLTDQATAITDETTTSACTNAYGSPDTSSTDYSACSLTGLLKRITDVLKIEFVNIVGKTYQVPCSLIMINNIYRFSRSCGIRRNYSRSC